MSKGLVCVTGAAGYLASNLIKQLIESGYKVRGTVRNINDETKVSHLKTLFPTLDLFEGNLLQEGSFDKAFDGCKYIFHTASPFTLTVPDAQRDLVDPALQGTLHALRSAKKAGTVKRIVITSSIAAVVSSKPYGYVYTEADWNFESTLTVEPYRYSKRVAEESAWNFVKQPENSSLELVVINPSFVLGPPLSKRFDSESVVRIANILNGSHFEKGMPPYALGCVDVRDVVKAHILAVEIEKAAGNRYLLSSNQSVPSLTYATILKKHFPKYPIPTHYSAPFNPNTLTFDTTKAQRELGLHFIPTETTIIDMANALIALEIVPKKD